MLNNKNDLIKYNIRVNKSDTEKQCQAPRLRTVASASGYSMRNSTSLKFLVTDCMRWWLRPKVESKGWKKEAWTLARARPGLQYCVQLVLKVDSVWIVPPGCLLFFFTVGVNIGTAQLCYLLLTLALEFFLWEESGLEEGRCLASESDPPLVQKYPES
jgi:ferredoxin-like protein FixX